MPGGAENVVHGVRMLLLEYNPGNVCLTEEHFPELASLDMEVLWGQAASVVEGSGASALCSWCPARRSTGPFLLFCLAVHPVLKKLARVLFHWPTWMTSTWSLVMQGTEGSSANPEG